MGLKRSYIIKFIIVGLSSENFDGALGHDFLMNQINSARSDYGVDKLGLESEDT